MNREILFKAKRKDNGKWVEGYYIYHIKRTICPLGDSVKPEDEQHVIMQDGFSDWNMPRNTVVYEIDPDTLCQYTGQRYKCGKKVSENDIVTISAYSYDEPESDTTGIVVYSKGKACWCLKDLNSDETIPMYECYGSYITQISYIGNIFDNPELLEVEEKWQYTEK